VQNFNNGFLKRVVARVGKSSTIAATPFYIDKIKSELQLMLYD
jgi:hypothetical protein